MESDWAETTLGEVLELKRGYDLPKRLRRSGNVPVISSAGKSDDHEVAKVDGPGVVTGRYGTIGEVYYCEEAYWPLNTTLYVRDFKGNDRKFVYYFLKTINYLEYSDKAAVPGVNRNHLHMAEVRIPKCIHAQKSIAHILGTLDDKIELNRRMNETLESMARALFKSWFVDFDPVIDNALAAGNPIPEPLSQRAQTRRDLGTKRKPLPKNIQKLFPDSFFFDDELGWMPEGWTCKSPTDMSQLFSGGTPKKSNEEYWGGDLPWISPKAMMTIHAFDSAEHVTSESVGNGTRLVPKGTVLVMVRGMGLHQGVRISQARRDVTFNQDVKALVPTTVRGDFLLFAMLDARQLLFGKVQSSGHGTGVIPTDIIQKLRFAVPPPEVLAEAVPELTNINDRIHASTMACESLTKLRDTLLPKLLSGELRIPDAEKLVAGSL
jgi:type I restriction enzyme S subunit